MDAISIVSSGVLRTELTSKNVARIAVMSLWVKPPIRIALGALNAVQLHAPWNGNLLALIELVELESWSTFIADEVSAYPSRMTVNTVRPLMVSVPIMVISQYPILTTLPAISAANRVYFKSFRAIEVDALSTVVSVKVRVICDTIRKAVINFASRGC